MDQLLNPAGEAAPSSYRRGSRLLPAGIVALAAVLLVGVPGTLANAQLSSTYSAEQSVHLYFAAQARGDAAGMTANATFLRGDGSYSQFFDGAAVAAMLRQPGNRDVGSVTVVSDRALNGATHAVTVSMVWRGSKLNRTYQVAADPSQSHYGIYHSWRIRVPSSTIHLQLPAQPGPIAIDGIEAPAAASGGTVQVIQGFHSVSMSSTDLFESAITPVDARTPTASATLPGNLSAAAASEAKLAVMDTFHGTCDPAKYFDCLGHAYQAPDQNYIYYFKLPGYADIEYTKYVVALTGDPTAGMRLVPQAEAGKVSASGACAYTFTVDGSRKYYVKGTWSGVLTWNLDGFDTDLNLNCEDSKA